MPGASEHVARLLRTPKVLYVSRLADYEARKFLARQANPAAEENLNFLLTAKFSHGKEWAAAILQALISSGLSVFFRGRGKPEFFAHRKIQSRQRMGGRDQAGA